jgi:hypothetical protein
MPCWFSRAAPRYRRNGSSSPSAGVSCSEDRLRHNQHVAGLERHVLTHVTAVDEIGDVGVDGGLLPVLHAHNPGAVAGGELCAQAATGRRVRSTARTQTLYVTGRSIVAGAVARVLVIARTRRELRLVQDQPLQLAPVHVRQGVHQRLPRCHPGPRDQNNLPW